MSRNTIKLELAAKQALASLGELTGNPFLGSMMTDDEYKRAITAAVKLSHALYELNKEITDVD